MALYEQGVVVQYQGHGHTALTLSTTVEALPAPPDGVDWSRIRRVAIRNLAQPMDWTDAVGETPDGVNSFKSLANEIVVLDTDFQNFRMVRSPDATADADVRIAYFGI